MKWFNKWLANKVRKGLEHEKEVNSSIHNPISRGPQELSSRGMTFTLYHGVGGYVVEMRNYNKKTDMHDTSLHIISSDKDLGESLTKVITYELVKQ